MLSFIDFKEYHIVKIKSCNVDLQMSVVQINILSHLSQKTAKHNWKIHEKQQVLC